MSAKRYPEEFKIEAVKKILEHGHSVADVSRRLGVSTHASINGLGCSKFLLHISLRKPAKAKNYAASRLSSSVLPR
jgi:transposase